MMKTVTTTTKRAAAKKSHLKRQEEKKSARGNDVDAHKSGGSDATRSKSSTSFEAFKINSSNRKAAQSGAKLS